MRSARGTSLVVSVAVVLSALALVATPVGAAPAPPPPPPGPVNGSGNFEGTEAVLDEGLIDTTCFFRNTRTVFALRGIGTFAGTTAGGQPVAYKAEIGTNEEVYANGPVQIEVESTATYYHGPGGTFGTSTSDCSSANYGGSVPAMARLFAPDHLYRLDGGGAQVPCTGTGSFYRYGGSWHADWSLDGDCTVVGNAAGTPGTGAALQGSLFTHDGEHDPCSDVCTTNIRFDAKEYLAIPGSGVTLVGSTDSAQVGDNVTVTARVTNDGVAQSGVTVNFSVAGPGATTPPSGSALTGADGRATFALTASVVGNYTVTASAPSATTPGQFVTATLAVAFTPPDPPTIVLSGPTTAPTEESQTLTALFTDARVPVAGSTINFSVTGDGVATPASGSAVTDAYGKARFTFAGDRAGDYTVTASTTYNAQPVSDTHTVTLSINTFYRAGGVTLASGENNLTSAVIDPTGSFGYFGTSTNPGRVVKVDLATMARVGAITLPTGENNLTSAVIDPAGHFAYFGTGSNPGAVVKVDLTTFTRVGAITLPTGEGALTSAVIDPAGAFAYFGTGVNAAAGRVVKIDLGSFTRVGAITFAADETRLLAAVLAPGGATAYFAAKGAGTSAGRLVKVDLASFTRVGAVALVGPDENNPVSAVIDPAGDFAYLGTNVYPASRVIKIDLNAFARVGALEVYGIPLEGEDEGFTSEASLYSAVMAPDGRHAYFGASGTPSQVIEIDLATFTRGRTVVLPTGETNLRSAVLAPDGRHAYFGTGNSPAKVVKLALVRPPNPALVAGDDSYTTPYAVPLTLAAPGVLANDVDTGDGDPLIAAQASDPPGGSVSLNPDGSFTYTPDLGFTGTDTFTYTADDTMNYSAPATVSVSVGMAPEDVSDVFGGAFGYFTNVGLFGGPRENRGPAPTVTLPLVGGDVSATDPDGDVAIYGPAYIFENHGALDVHTTGTTGAGGSVTSSSAVHNVEDNDPFHAGSPDGEISSTCTATSEGVSGSTHIVNGRLVLHIDPDTLEPTEEVVFDHDYDPAPNTEFSGAIDNVGDQWRIVLNEQILGPDSITVNALHMYLLGPTARGEMIIGQSRCGVRVADPNAAPVAADDTFTVTQGQPPLVVEGPGLLANDTDADAQPLTAAKLTPIAPAAQDGDWAFPSDPDHGRLTLNPDGSFTYTPDAGYVGPDSFTYVAQDSRGKTDVATVDITVNSPPVATDDAYGTTANAPLAVAAPGVLTNDTDADGGTLSATPLANPTHGALTLNPDGSFTYTPDAAYTGADSFTYTLSDGQTGTDTGLVTIAVNSANAAPVATDDTYTTNEDTALTVNAPGLLGNDTDADANPLTAGSATSPAHGSVVLNANGSFTYTPAANYRGPDSFDYTTSDGQGGTDSAIVTINVMSANDAPVAVDDSYSTNEDTPLTVAAPGVLANDTDVDTVFTATSATDPPNGSVTLNADGSLTYTPDAHYNGADSFTYTASDGAGGTDTALVTIAVASIPDAPIAGDDTYSINNGTPLTIAAPGVLANDTDGDANALSASAASDPAGGSVVLNANGGFTYNADGSFVGTDTFTYTVSDGTGRTDTGLVTITVLPSQASLLKDVNPGSGTSRSFGFIQMGDAVYFLSENTATQGLWRTDGTEAGTVLVKSIAVVWDDRDLVLIGNHLYFGADDGVTGRELWKSDGTTAGTVLVSDSRPGAAGLNPFEITASGNTLFFQGNDGIHGIEPWKSDGTAAGTVMVKDISSGAGDSNPGDFTTLGGVVVFAATDGETTGFHGREVWKSDGTEAGTVLLKDVRPGTGSATGFRPRFTKFGDTVLFSANDGTTGIVLWKSDGTEAGTVLVKAVRVSGGEGSLVVAGDTALFAANDGFTAPGHGNELWKTDGTPAGTVLVKEINPGSTRSGNPENFTVVGDTVLFSAEDGPSTGLANNELWKTDGTAAGTVLVKDINPGTGSSISPANPTNFAVSGGNAYLRADDGAHGSELWKSDGTAAGTVLVQDINPGAASSYSSATSRYLAPVLATMYFTANDGIHGDEPWRLAPGPTPPVAVSASPSTVTAGSSVSATWSNVVTPTPTDWVGLYPTSDTLDPGLLSWAYTGGAATGSLGLSVPAGAPPGATYEVRLFSNNAYTRLATSAPFSVVASATAVSASPSSVNPGAPVTATYSGISAPTATDWVGLYDSSSAPEPALLNWAYTSGTAGGSLSLFVPGTAPLGATYELRLFTNNSYTRIATSAPFSVAASTATVAATPAAVNPGAPLTATWSGIAAPTATDWVGLYDSSSTPNPGLLNWAYTNGTAAGSVNLVVPAGAPLGTTYELRLFTNNSYTRLATSAPFSVAVSTATVSASPASVANGSPVTATWSGIAGPTATDWVGLYPTSGTADPGVVAWAYTGGAASGSLNLTVPAGSPPGTTYELRLYSSNSYTRLATSAPFGVS